MLRTHTWAEGDRRRGREGLTSTGRIMGDKNVGGGPFIDCDSIHDNGKFIMQWGCNHGMH